MKLVQNYSDLYNDKERIENMEKRVVKDTKEQIVENTILTNYDKYYRLAYSYVHNDADAADIVQNGAYRAILYCSSLREESYACTWVYRIMLNEIFRFCKETQRKNISLDEIEIVPSREDVYEDFDLRRALDTLNLKDKIVVELRYFEDMKLEDIAEVLEENLSTVKSRLYRSMKKLRLQLE